MHAAANGVPTVLGSPKKDLKKQMTEYELVDCRYDIREACATLDRESVVSLFLMSESKKGREIEAQTLCIL